MGGTGWRRAFCTTASGDPETKGGGGSVSADASPRMMGKRLGLFAVFGSHSNPSTPRLSCRTGSPRSQRNDAMMTTPRTELLSSSPCSPLKLSFFKTGFKFRSMCGVCFHSVKTGSGTAVYTAVCGHAFHFPCITFHISGKGSLVCPVCDTAWKDVSLLRGIHWKDKEYGNELENKKMFESSSSTQVVDLAKPCSEPCSPRLANLLASPKAGTIFTVLPEADEGTGQRCNDRDNEEFRGFFVNANPSSSLKHWDEAMALDNSRELEVKLMPESALVSVGPTHLTYVLGFSLKAPPLASTMQSKMQVPIVDTPRRAPIDLVAVLDVGSSMTGAKLQMLKRAVRLVVCSLSSTDRLSLVSFSAMPTGLLPLMRMTTQGQQVAHRIIDGLSCGRDCGGSIDALRHAAKVLDERRERNPVASIIMLSDGRNDGIYHRCKDLEQPDYHHVSSTRFAHVELPVGSVGFRKNLGGGCNDLSDDTFTKCLSGLLSVTVQDLNIKLGFAAESDAAEIAAVYSCGNGRPALLGSNLIRIGNLYAGEVRELLLEVRVPTSKVGSNHVMTVQCGYRDPVTQEALTEPKQTMLVPRLQGMKSTDLSINWLRSLFITTRAIVEARRLVDLEDFKSAYQMLMSARALVMQSRPPAMEYFAKELEAELAEVNLSRQLAVEMHQGITIQRIGKDGDGGEPITPNSARRADC